MKKPFVRRGSGLRRQPVTRSFRPKVELLEKRELLNGVSDTDSPFLKQAYADLLGRSVDAAGLAAWSAMLDGGVSHKQVALAIEQSPEFETKLIQGLYGTYLGRPADTLGVSTFVPLLAAGSTVEQVQALILGSPEYFEGHGSGTNDTFLESVYQDVLGRTIDPTGQAAWGTMLQPGSSPDALSARLRVATDVLNSLEAREDLVKTYYTTYLMRSPDDTGLGVWVGALQQGARDEQVVSAIVGSPEFLSAAGPPTGAGAVVTLGTPLADGNGKHHDPQSCSS